MFKKNIQSIILYMALSFLMLYPTMAHSSQFDLFQKDFGLKPNSHIEMQAFIEQLTKQVEAEPFKADLYYYLARAYASQGWEDKASQYLSQWIKISNSGIVIKDNHAFFLDEKNDKVLVIDTNTKQVIRKIDMPWLPRKMMSTPNEAKIYVTASLANSVSVLNTEDMTIGDTIKTGAMPWDIKTSPEGDRVYVANLKSDDVSVIDTSKNAMLEKVKVGQGPWSIALSSDGHKLYVSNQDSRDLRVIDTGSYSVVDVLSIGANPRDMVIAPDDQNTLYLADTDIANNELEIYVVDLEDLGIVDTMSVSAIDDPLLVKFQKMNLMDKINTICNYARPNGSNSPKQLPVPKSEALGRLVFGSQNTSSKIRHSIVDRASQNEARFNINNSTALASPKPVRNTFLDLPATSSISSKAVGSKKQVLRIVVVVKNDTLWKISVDNYGMATEAIFKAIQNVNPTLENVNMIYAGQKIKLPEMNQASPAPAVAEIQTGPKSVIVKPNDNLFRIILANYGEATEKIYAQVLKANPHIGDRNQIVIGQRIRLPEIQDSSPGSNFEHIAAIPNDL